MSETEEIAKAVQEGSKTANNLLNKIANVVGYVFEIKKHKKDAQKSLIDEIGSTGQRNGNKTLALMEKHNCNA